VNVGDRVRMERDETRYPSRGTWPQFRGRTGTVIEVNTDRRRPRLTEYGVVFGATRSRPDGSLAGSGTTWFKAYEMQSLAPERTAEHATAVAPMDATTHQDSPAESPAA
jgi:hypothetical protein